MKPHLALARLVQYSRDLITVVGHNMMNNLQLIWPHPTFKMANICMYMSYLMICVKTSGSRNCIHTVMEPAKQKFSDF